MRGGSGRRLALAPALCTSRSDESKDRYVRLYGFTALPVQAVIGVWHRPESASALLQPASPLPPGTIGADVGSWKEVERAFKEADSVNKRMKAGSRMQRHAQRDLKSSAVPRIPLRHGHPPHDARMDFQKEL